MSVRVGVDVGGTFTKAVAFDAATGAMVGHAIAATTHDDADGVAAGVVDAVRQLTSVVPAASIGLVTHSTTEAINAMLEGDVARVGLVGMSTRRDRRKTRKLTSAPRIRLADGHELPIVTEYIDTTTGLTTDDARAAVSRLVAAGAEAIAIVEAFSPDDPTNEQIVAEAARELGLPVTPSVEITGLYGLELRAVTAALNAAIIPIALRTANVVDAGLRGAGIEADVMVMRGDGGATDLAGFRHAPARTLYSGQAASVSGVLRTARVDDAVIVEVGGTSTNVAAIRHGRPALSYVSVASHATALRALDVRVIGVAGGSMLRARRRSVYGVGPRSAHISGLPYASFLTADELEGATPERASPRPGDPSDYVVLRLRDGRAAALTLTCAANAAGIVQETDYARGDIPAAEVAFAIVGRSLGMAGLDVANQMITAATQTVGDLVAKVVHDHKLAAPTIVAVGGGAGALGRAVGRAMNLEVLVPEHSEIISAIGDALSLVRAEREKSMTDPTPDRIDQFIADVEAEVIESGAASNSLESRVEHVADRGAVRVTVTGAIGLASGAVPGRAEADPADIARLAAQRGYAHIETVGRYWLTSATPSGPRFGVFDRYGDLVIDVNGTVVRHSESDVASAVEAALERHRRIAGPLTFHPHAWVIGGTRCVEVGDLSTASIVRTAELLGRHQSDIAILIGKE